MTKKLLIIGIDALDSDTLFKIKHELPNFSLLMESSKKIFFDGVFPPDSPTSWASIYTGLNPTKHGIVLFVDPLQRVSKMISKDVDDTIIHGKTFWDIAGKFGKKVCIIPHLLGFPVWPVNGMMIGRSSVTPDVQIYPDKLKDKFDISNVKWDLDLFPGREKDNYINLAKSQIEREVNFSLEIYDSSPWDIFFVSFGELDPIQYSFWNFYDEKDPSYPKEINSYKETILEFYKIFDDALGKFLSKIDSDTIVIIVSDHGIGSRPIRLVNINEFLRQYGYLIINSDAQKQLFLFSIASKLKKIVLNIVDKYDLGNFAAASLKLYPKLKDWMLSNSNIDWEKSLAYLTDQSGIKNYPYGGIFVKMQSEYQYNEMRDKIIREFSQLKDDNNESVFKWISRREDLYEGPFIERYPDLIFELNENYGAGSEVLHGSFGYSVTHNIAPGCHKQHHATFLISGFGEKELLHDQMTLMDVTPTILDLLNIDWRFYNFDGKSIFQTKK